MVCLLGWILYHCNSCYSCFAVGNVLCIIMSILTEIDLHHFQAEALDLDITVLQTVEEVAENWKIDDIKGLLGRYNFKADMLDRKVSLLSGGEKVN